MYSSIRFFLLFVYFIIYIIIILQGMITLLDVISTSQSIKIEFYHDKLKANECISPSGYLFKEKRIRFAF